MPPETQSPQSLTEEILDLAHLLATQGRTLREVAVAEQADVGAIELAPAHRGLFELRLWGPTGQITITRSAVLFGNQMILTTD